VIGTLARRLYLSLVAVFLVAPLVIVGSVSFNSQARMNFPPQHPSLIWYRVFFTDPGWMSAFTLSIVVASLAALVAGSIALPIAYAVWRYRSRAAIALRAAARVSFLLPSIVVSIVFLAFWSSIGHAGYIEDTILSHGIVFVTLPLAMIGLGFAAIDPALIEAARTMGARDSEVLHTVIRPIVLPYILSGLIFVFILSLNEYIIAYMVAGFEVETLPIKVFNNLRMGFTPTMCVGAVLFLLLEILGFGTIALIGDLPKLLGARESHGSK
jgi:putative spermidine/putrescine transport system permease protein